MRGVICNTSPLQYLHQAGVLYLLPALYGNVQVPQAVAEEIAAGHRRNVFLPALEELPWVDVRSVDDPTLLPLVTSLGCGEKEVLALGLENADSLLLLDDRDARRYATTVGLDITGTLGILLLAKERGILESIRPTLDRLRTLRFRLSDRTCQAALVAAGEGS